MQNRIDASLSTANKDRILQLVQEIRKLLLFLLDLSTDKIALLSKKGKRSRSFAKDFIINQDKQFFFIIHIKEILPMRKYFLLMVR